MSTFAFAALFIVAVIALAAQHAYLTRRHEEEVDYLRDDLDAEVGKRYSAEAAVRAADQTLMLADQHARDTAALMTVGAARIEILESELARIAAQVKGKCLWPTLGSDDVVVSLDERRAAR